MTNGNLIKQDDIVLSTFTDERITELVEASAVTGIKNKGEFLMFVQRAKELNLGFANAAAHFHIVNGKLGIDIHIIKAILSRPSAGVEWEQIDNFRPMYEYTDGKSVY